MIHENVEFHNVGELRPINGKKGLRLQRVPEHVRVSLNDAVQMRMLHPDTAEIRFVLDEPGRSRVSRSTPITGIWG